MDALFIVPTMVSHSVNDRIVPALAKLVERNILLTYAGPLRLALLKKFSGIFTTIRKEDVKREIEKYLKEYGYPKTKDEKDRELKRLEEGKRDTDDAIDFAKQTADTYGADSGDNTSGWKHSTSGIEDVELPKGITFYSMISLEPTYLTIPIKAKKVPFLGREAERVITIGIKCVPYQMKDVNNVMSTMNYVKSLSIMKKYFFSKWNSIKSKIPLTDPREIRKGAKTGSAVDILFSPNSQYLANPNKLSKMMNIRKEAAWSTLVILSSTDFKDKELSDTIFNYRKLTKGGWGDMLVVNESSETIYYCSSRLNACQTIPFVYLRQIMNLQNILDYNEISKWNKPFKYVSVGKALMDSTIETPAEVINETKSKILKIIN